MDLQKEREAFEAWFIENGILIDTDFNVAKRAFEAGAAWQAAKDESHKQAALYQSEINHLAQANQQWREKAAKAQAIPDGFVVVPKEPTQELLNKMQDFFVGAFENGLTGGQSMHCAYIAMIEAQE